MPRFSRLSSISGIAVAGAALGLYLGNSAVSEINPAYYSTPISASAFHADLVPNAPQQGLYQPLPELAAVVADVGGPRNASSYFAGPDHSSFVGETASPTSYRAAAAEVVLAEADRFVSGRPSPEAMRDIERYAHFRVSEDEEAPRLLSLQSVAEPGEAVCSADDACGEEPAPGI